MSHLDTIDLPVADIEAAKTTAKILGGELVRKSTYNWYGHHVGDYPLPKGFTESELGKCEYAIKVPGTTWEIGLAKAKGDDHYTLLFDFYGSQGRVLEQWLGGKDGKRFKKEYTVQCAINAAKRQGYMTRRIDVKGRTQLVLTGM